MTATRAQMRFASARLPRLKARPKKSDSLLAAGGSPGYKKRHLHSGDGQAEIAALQLSFMSSSARGPRVLWLALMVYVIKLLLVDTRTCRNPEDWGDGRQMPGRS